MVRLHDANKRPHYEAHLGVALLADDGQERVIKSEHARCRCVNIHFPRAGFYVIEELVRMAQKARWENYAVKKARSKLSSSNEQASRIWRNAIDICRGLVLQLMALCTKLSVHRSVNPGMSADSK